MLDKLKPRALPLAVNKCLLIALFAFTLLYSLFVDSTSGRVFLVLSKVTAGFVIIPFVPLVCELGKMAVLGKVKSTSSNVQHKVDDLSHLMNVKKKVTVKLVDDWRGAKCRDTNILLGKPLLDNLDDDSINGVLVHELAHIRKSLGGRECLEIIIPFLSLIYYSRYFYDVRSIPHWPNLLVLFPLYILMFIIVFRVIGWRQEYEADGVGAKYLGRDKMIVTLQKVAKLKGTVVERDFYFHPSISRRIANLKTKQGEVGPSC